MTIEEKAYKERCERKQKVRITFECELPGYNADGDPLQALAYVAMKIGHFVWTPKDFHGVKLDKLDRYEDEVTEASTPA